MNQDPKQEWKVFLIVILFLLVMVNIGGCEF